MLREINGILRQTNLPDESEEYLSKREELRRAEIELRNQRERVAELRRRLPQGPAVEDYVFEEVPLKLEAEDKPLRTVRLSQLFTGPNRSVVLYHFMYGKKQTKPCPMCTAWIDSFNGIAHHLAPNLDLAIVAAALLTLTPAHFFESRVGVDPLYPLPFVMAWLLCLVTFEERSGAPILFGGVFLLAIGFYSYIASVILMPVYFVVTCLVLFLRHKA